MKKIRRWYRDNALRVFWVAVVVFGLSWLFLYRLGSIPGGMSQAEIMVANGNFGWHGLYQTLLYAPLNIVRSIVFFAAGHHGQFLTRLPNAIFGIMSVIGFGWLLWLWHGGRTAILGTILFATSAWTLHISRVATNDVMYIWMMVMLLVSNALLYRHASKVWAVYTTALLWVCILFIPGGIWLLLINAFWQRGSIATASQTVGKLWQRIALLALLFIPILVLLASLLHSSQWLAWLGLPSHLINPLTVIHNFFAAVFHVYIRGPLLPDVWLGRLPILDVLAAVCSVVGLYFYGKNFDAGRSRMLASIFIAALVLIALGGPVTISLMVPLLFGLVATGLAYILREWLKVFPINPFARSIGLGLIIVAVSLSAIYNMRAYFIAWPHNPVTQVIYRYHRS